jgi:BMFP domain-containing protein YqiC
MTPANFPEANMVQTTNRFFDDMARLMNDAAGMAQGLRREAETMFRGQAERILNEFAVVQREEFEAVREMARLAREENEKLRARIAALEAQIGGAHEAGQTTVAGTTEPPPSTFA